ncbi:MAG: NgoPII family restriction endonuclease [Bacteroidetes bacterium]|nr:NgoPII family restriction endonuclease [Bacteroidota bacterium]
MTNILEAILHIAELPILNVDQITFGNNRITSVGDGLEIFVKNAFSNNFNTTDESTKITKYAEVFSYEGSQTRPPDLMIKGGDAIEVKKTESILSELQLNSSHPKAKLFANSHLINNHCRTCEKWEEKDIIYAIGHVPKSSKILSSLWLVYGNIYAADDDVYTNLKATVAESLENTPEINFSETKELGRVNYVDPLKITNMRIRGMWLLQPPVKVFNYVYTYNTKLKFQLVAIVPNDKYNSFPIESRNKIEKSVNDKLSIQAVKIKNPNNPVHLMDCKLITIKTEND